MRGKNLKVLKNNINIEQLCNQLIWYLTVILITIMALFDGHDLVQVLMYGITACVGFLILIKERTTFRPKIQSYHVIIMIFIGICYASSLWGWDTGYPISTSGYIIRIFICMSVFYYHYEKQESVAPLIQAVKWGGYMLAYICLIGYDLRNVVEILLKGGRLFNAFVCFIEGKSVPGLFYGIFTPNINFLGKYVAIAAVIGFLDMAYHRKNLFCELLYVLPAVVFIAISGGKMNFLMLFIGVFIILLLKTRRETTKKTLLSWGIILIVTIAVLYILSFIPMFEETFNRFRQMIENLLGTRYEVSTNERVTMFKVGMEQFIKTPIGGIGVDNARFLLEREAGIQTYLHCNYIELLTGVGAIGTLAFYLCYGYPALQFLKYRKCVNEHTKTCIVLLIVSLIADIASITYTLRITYLLFGIYFIHAKKLKEQNNRLV